MAIRPPARIESVIASFPGAEWDVIGALGTEDRSTFVPLYLQAGPARVRSLQLVEVLEAAGSPFAAAGAKRRTETRAVLRNVSPQISSIPLLARSSDVVKTAQSLVKNAGDSVVLDISGLPKRIFFPLIRSVLGPQSSAKNVILTYTVPQSYGFPGDRLSLDPGEFSPLPTFGSDREASSPERVAIAVGFQFLGLLPILNTSAVQRVKVDALVPFPTPVEHLGRVRDFLRELAASNPGSRPRQLTVSPIGLWSSYAILRSIQQQMVWLLPYGPKPIAAAMALAALRKGWPVYYTQPTAYRPDYSIGIARDTSEVCWAYVVRANGVDFY